MTDKPEPPPARPRDADRRLGAALRENLKRRKAQARGRADAAALPPDDDGAPPSPDRERDG